MSSLPIDRPSLSRCMHCLRVWRYSCAALLVVCLGLFVASITSMVVGSGEFTRTLRPWMLQAGLPLLAFLIAFSVMSLERVRRGCEGLDFDFVRSRERLYFIATVGVMVLLPSAVLAQRWLAAPRPGGELAIRAVEALALLIVALLLLRNQFDAREARRQAEESPEGRSMSSMR